MSNLRSVPSTRMRLVRRLAIAITLLALAALALGGAIGPLQSGVLTMVPALALGLLMLSRPYLGQHLLARLRARSRRTDRAAALGPRPVRPVAFVARGGRLIAVALAGRAPPLAFARR